MILVLYSAARSSSTAGENRQYRYFGLYALIKPQNDLS